jgi:RepB DNA-primase N-terminal domain
MNQAMEAQRDSRIVAARVAMDQLEALGAPAFDIGVKRVDGTMIMREGWGAKQVLKSLLWLRRENLNRGHIYVRPAGPHGLSLVDDLTAEALTQMKREGFAPAAVIETSPRNFQAWLRHGVVLDEAISTHVAKVLAERFGGDPSSADWRHFGRLAGFTNPKPNRRLASGLQPFARLVEANGQVYREAAKFTAEVRAAITSEALVAEAGNGHNRAATVSNVKL